MMRGIFYPMTSGNINISFPTAPSSDVSSIEIYEQEQFTVSVGIDNEAQLFGFCDLGELSVFKNNFKYLAPNITGDNDFINDTIYLYETKEKKAVGAYLKIKVKVNKIPGVKDDLISNINLADNALSTKNLI